MQNNHQDRFSQDYICDISCINALIKKQKKQSKTWTYKFIIKSHYVVSLSQMNMLKYNQSLKFVHM